MTEDIIFAGFGGQGIMLMGKILARAALLENKAVTWLPSYGAEVRGGTAHCMIKISDKLIASPFIEYPDTFCAMNQPSLNKFTARIKNKGLLIINSSLAKKIPRRKNVRIFSVPLTDIAVGLGNIRVANTIALGVYVAKKKIVSLKSIVRAMKEIAPPDKRALLEINQQALEKGFTLGQSHD
ncbi:2-oxoacid:acceptor oxidoreductase family protein [Candidatus Omnitrophota bacterium]